MTTTSKEEKLSYRKMIMGRFESCRTFVCIFERRCISEGVCLEQRRKINISKFDGVFFN